MGFFFAWKTTFFANSFDGSTEILECIGGGRKRPPRNKPIRPGKVAWTMRLAMLAPDIIHRILSGVIPQNFTLEKLRVPLPDLWKEQRAMLFGE
ncbi:MAG: hypothetical protein J6X55_04705 [Victivallales bacterium]|nr:hypothetical protein [Victivallales bacterium]